MPASSLRGRSQSRRCHTGPPGATAAHEFSAERRLRCSRCRRDQDARLDLVGLLAAVENASPVAAADVLAERLTDALGASEVSFLVADFSGRALVRLGHADSAAASRTQGRETAERVPLVGSPHGRALAGQTLEVETDAHGVRLFAPVTNRGEAIGVLQLSLPQLPDEQTLTDVALAAHTLAYVIIANRRFTDLFEWGQRSVRLSLAAEIQHRLLPGSYTCEAGQFTLAAWLEPSGDIAGDTFDFAIERDTLHVSITDAMGHAINASMLATILVGALRNARRAGVDLGEQARLANAGLGDYTGWSGLRNWPSRAHRSTHPNRDHRQRGSPTAAPASPRPRRVRRVGGRRTLRDRARHRIPGSTIAARAR